METARKREQRNSERVSIKNDRYGRSLLMCMSDAGAGVEEICPTFRRVGLSSRGSAYGGLHQVQLRSRPSAIISDLYTASDGRHSLLKTSLDRLTRNGKLDSAWTAGRKTGSFHLSAAIEHATQEQKCAERYMAHIRTLF